MAKRENRKIIPQDKDSYFQIFLGFGKCRQGQFRVFPEKSTYPTPCVKYDALHFLYDIILFTYRSTPRRFVECKFFVRIFSTYIILLPKLTYRLFRCAVLSFSFTEFNEEQVVQQKEGNTARNRLTDFNLTKQGRSCFIVYNCAWFSCC